MKLNPIAIVVPLIFLGTWVGMSLLGQDHPPAPPGVTNSAIAHPERKKRVIAYRKECPECGVSLTSTNVSSWVVNDETNAVRMVSVQFQCLGCDEVYVETFTKPVRKTKVEEITVEIVK